MGMVNVSIWLCVRGGGVVNERLMHIDNSARGGGRKIAEGFGVVGCL